jgi:hypothetical protein
MTHAHLTTIVLTLIFFLITLNLQKKGRSTKVSKMILRVMYLLTILTGGMLFIAFYKMTILYTLKAVLGVAVIGMFEIILAGQGNGRNTAVFWVLFLILFLVTLFLGLKLPAGIYMFN